MRRRSLTLLRLLAQRTRWDATGIINDAAELARRHEGEWIPTSWDATSPAPGTQALDIHPHLLRIRAGRVLARPTDTAVYTASNRMIGFGASSFLDNHDDQYLELKRHPFYRRSLRQRPFNWLPEPHHIKGSAFLLHAPWSHNNYYHFLIDLLPKLGIFSTCQKIDSASIPVFTTTPLDGSYRCEVLSRINSQLTSFSTQPILHISADDLYVVALARNRNDLSMQAVTYLRSLFAEEIVATGMPQRRLFVRRGSQAARPLLNEAELCSTLESRGYEIIQPDRLSVADQARLFASARVVIGQHGAGLTNIAFCQPDCTVVEMFSLPWHDPHYKRLSQHVGSLYIPFSCEGNADQSLRVDISSLIHVLAERNLA